MSKERIAEEVGNCVRQRIPWMQLPVHLKEILHNNQRDYEKYVFNYSLKNQLRFRGNLASKVFRHEQRYYELLIQKSINSLCLFPYHLADIVTKGLRVTPFNYYVDVLNQLLKNDMSYDSLPNFTAADCLRVLGIGRNEYLSLISELKTHTNRVKLFIGKPDPMLYLPKFPVTIRIEPWWRIDIGYVLESDIKYVNAAERGLLDDLIDFGSQLTGKCDYNVVHSLYRKGLIYLDVPISGEDRISIPPLKNFVMNRTSGDYFENLLYKIFVSADELMTISELAQMLLVDLDTVKQAVSLFCRLGFAQLKQAANCDSPSANLTEKGYHQSWIEYSKQLSKKIEPPQITPLNYNQYIMTAEANQAVDNPNGNIPNENGRTSVNSNDLTQNSPKQNSQDRQDSSSIGYLSSDGNTSDFSFANMPSPLPQDNILTNNDGEQDLSSEMDDISESTTKPSLKETLNNGILTLHNEHSIQTEKPIKIGKRVAFLFDSTLTAFLMMGNLSPGLKNHAVTMFEVGKLCEESLDIFLQELEKVSLLDAEGEGDVSRYFAHAVILRSTICSLRNLLPGGLDLLRLECLECLDQKTRDRVLEKKYDFMISAAPLTSTLSYCFTIPFFGQFYRSSDASHMWSKLFYNHITGYGPPSLFLCRGTVLKHLPRIFLGYGKLLVNILHSDSYVINSENFRNINDQLKNGCVLIQGYGIRTQGEICYEAFPFDQKDPKQMKWFKHKAIENLRKYMDLEYHCGIITFLNTGVPDIGSELQNNINVNLQQPKPKIKYAGTAIRYKDSKLINSNSIEMIQSVDKKDSLILNVNSTTIDAFSPNSELNELTNFTRANTNYDHEHNHDVDGGRGGGGGDFVDNDDPNNIKKHHINVNTTSPERNLKSPDENYFADSPKGSNSPANCFTSEDCTELLASELAKCQPDNNYKAELVSQSSVEIPINSNDNFIKNEKILIDGYIKDDNDFSTTEEWTLLDVNFGVPLFDVDCNTRICEQIVRKLSNPENLQKLTMKSSEMNELFTNFVKQCLYFEEELDLAEHPKLSKWAKQSPYPRINLAFENGRVCYWNGR